MQLVQRIGSPSAIVLFLVLAFAPYFIENLFFLQVLTVSLLYGAFAISWDILSGCTDEMNFGHGFFICSGGYAAALLNTILKWPTFFTIPAGGVVTALLGALVGWLTLRLKGPHFSMVTIALAAILYKISFIYWPVFRGEEGISGVTFLSSSLETDYYICLLFLIGAYMVLYNLARGRFGLVLKAIKADEDAAQASGIPTARYKISAFTLSGLFAGLAGGFYAHLHGQVTAELTGGSLSVIIVLMAMIGTRGTITGPLLAAVLLHTLDEGLRVVEVYRILLFTASLILLIWLFPKGAVQGIQDWARRRRRLAGAALEGGVGGGHSS